MANKTKDEHVAAQLKERRKRRSKEALDMMDIIEARARKHTPDDREEVYRRHPLIKMLHALTHEELTDLLFVKDYISVYPEISLRLLELRTEKSPIKPENKGKTKEMVDDWKEWARERNIGKK